MWFEIIVSYSYIQCLECRSRSILSVVLQHLSCCIAFASGCPLGGGELVSPLFPQSQDSTRGAMFYGNEVCSFRYTIR